MSGALGLYRLQQVDSQIDLIRERLTTIQETLQNDRTLQEAREKTGAAEGRLKSAERELKSSEGEYEK